MEPCSEEPPRPYSDPIEFTAHQHAIALILVLILASHLRISSGESWYRSHVVAEMQYYYLPNSSSEVLSYFNIGDNMMMIISFL